MSHIKAEPGTSSTQGPGMQSVDQAALAEALEQCGLDSASDDEMVRELYISINFFLDSHCFEH
jgi:hypothetical protein